jgi:CheY-like chemotaxis protein/HPt (histidine-containing phosphotransfer) domain-containing protein
LLVVDDVPMNQEIASAFATAAGHEVTCVDGGAAAVQAAAQSDFDIILMDLRMPEVDGFEATRLIRALGGKRGRVPIVALTADAFPEQVDDCKRAGMISHVAKPFTQAALLTALANAIENRQDTFTTAKRISTVTLPVLNIDTFETSAAFLSPSAVESYLEDIIRTVEMVQNVIQARSSTQLGDQATDAIHTLAGKAGMFGFARLNEVAREVERAARTRQTIEDDLIAELDDALVATLAQTRHRLDAARATSRVASSELQLASK